MIDGRLLFDTGIDSSGFSTDLGKLTSVAAKAATAVTAAFKAASAAAIKIGSDFESSMSQVAATMGITSATEEFDTLSAAAKEMGETTKFSASQAGEALNYLALAGYDAEKAVSALPTVLNVAAAGGIELAAASDMVTDAMSALGLETSQMADFSDKLAVTAQKSNTSVSQLGEAILTVGGTAKNLAGGITELNTMLGVLADNGIKGSEGGTALRNVILSLSAPTDTAAEALEQLGVSAFDLSGNMRPLEDTFADLNSALGTLTQQQRTEVLNEIFNKVDLKSVNALLGTSAERFDELSGYIDDCSGAAAQMAETMDDNLKGDITILNSALEGLGIAAYEKFQVPMRTAVQEVTVSVGELTESLTDGELSGSFDKIASGVSNLVGNILELVADDVLPSLISGLGWVVDNGNILIPIITTAASAIITYKTAVTAAAAAQKILNATVVLNPYVLAISAVAGLTAALISLGGATDDLNDKAEESARAYEEQKNKVAELETELSNTKTKIEEIQAMGHLDLTDEQELIDLQNLNKELETQLELEKKILEAKAAQKSDDALAALYAYSGKGSLNNLEAALNEYKTTSAKIDELKSKLATADAEHGEELLLEIGRLEKSSNDQRVALLNALQASEDLAESLDETEKSATTADEQFIKLKDDIYELLNIEPEKETIDLGGYVAGSYITGDYEKRYNEAKQKLDEDASDLADQQEENTKLLKAAWEKAEYEYAKGTIASEEDLYAQKAAILEQYGNEELTEHWNYYKELYAYQKEYSENSVNLAKEAREDEWENIDRLNNLGLISDEEAAKKRLEFVKKYYGESAEVTDENYEYLKQVYDDNNSAVEAALEEQEKIVDDGLSEILKKYQNAYDELDKKRENYNRKLMSIGGDIFSVETVKDENGNENTTYTINNIDEQIKKMREYNAAVKKLKEQGASGSLLEELTSMDSDESANFAKYLSGMSDAEFAKINELYEEKQRVADELSRELYASDAQKISNAITNELGDLATSAYDYGAQSAKQFAAGFSESMSELGFNAFYGQLEAAGANRSYANYPSFTKNVSEQALTVALDVTGKSNVILDGNVIGQLITNYQGKKAKQTGG